MRHQVSGTGSGSLRFENAEFLDQGVAFRLRKNRRCNFKTKLLDVFNVPHAKPEGLADRDCITRGKSRRPGSNPRATVGARLAGRH
jgi:hypothetical protein